MKEKTKICTKCKQKKNIKEFYKDEATKDGLFCKCNLCVKNYYLKNKEKILLRQKQWCLEYKDVIKFRQKQWGLKNKEKKENYNYKWHLENKESVKKYNEEYNNKKRSGNLLVVCKQCNKSFFKRVVEIKKSKNNFCSKSCAGKFNNSRKTRGSNISKLELWIQKNLPKLYKNTDFYFNRRDIVGSELDIYVPSINLAFEINGKFHYEPIFGKEALKIKQIADNRKALSCVNNNIKLHIIDVRDMGNFNEKKAIPIMNFIQNTIEKSY